MMIDKDLAARLKSYRNFKHLTQKDVAAYLKVPHSPFQILKMVRGRLQ